MATRSALHDPSQPSRHAGNKRQIRFLPLPTKPPSWVGTDPSKWRPGQKILIRKSLWLWLSVLVLFISMVLFMVAFLTNGWGKLIVSHEVQIKVAAGNGTGFSLVSNNRTRQQQQQHVTQKPETVTQYVYGINDRYWEFGLWQCCRDDGFCLGSRWPPFYSATRAFAVLGLFGIVLTFAWMLGHAMENLIQYDPCTNISLITLNTCTGIFLLISVCCFGTLWPDEFKADFHGVQTYLNYSFYLAVDVVILVFIAAGLAVMDYVMLLKKLREENRDTWVTAEEILGEETEEDFVRDTQFNASQRL